MTDGQRIEEVQRRSGLMWKELATELGLASPQTFTDIRNGRHGISTKLANRIAERFPGINKQWLVFGEGPITNDEMAVAVPLYKGVSAGATAPLATPIGAVSFGTCFPQAELALEVTDDSMREYPHGCIVVLKEVSDKSLLMPGKDYVIETREFTAVKRVQRGDREGTITLYSTSEVKYPDGRLVFEPFTISLDSIQRVFSVLGYIYSQTAPIAKINA